MNDTVHIIWYSIPNDRVRDMKEIVGIVTTGWMDADAIVDRLNSADEEKGFSWSRNYWKEEVQTLTLATLAECRYFGELEE